MKAAVDVIAKGGLVMIPLGLCSVLALAVVIERAIRWLKLGGVSEADRVLAFAGRGDWDEAARAGEGSSSPVARVLAARPEIILADEPTSSLDDVNAEFVMEALHQAAEGRTLIVVSHDARVKKSFQRVIDFKEWAK